MNKSDIGLNAGKIWRLLSNYAKWDYGTLKRKSGLKDKELEKTRSYCTRRTESSTFFWA